MTALFPGPYEIDIEYATIINTVSLNHHIRINCVTVGTPSVGTPATTIQLATRGGSSVTMSIGVNNAWTQIRKWFHTTVSATSVTLWKYRTDSYEKDFVSTMALTNPAGISTTAVAPARQGTLTFRTGTGSIAKLQLMELSSTADNQIPLLNSNSGDPQNFIAAYFLSTEGWMTGRDRTFLVAPLRMSFTQNEALARKRFRPNS